MDHFTTALVESLVKGEDVKELFRKQLEQSVNQLIKCEFTVFLNYDHMIPSEIIRGIREMVTIEDN